MGFKRVFFSGCAGMLCLIPMAWVSFYFLDLTSLITGGLVSNINTALTAIGGFLGTAGAVIAILLSFFIGLALIFLFPIHWCIFYRPDDVILLIAVVLPWILCCAITSGIFAHSPRGGINTSLAIGIGYAIIVTILYLIMSFIPFIGLIIDGVVLGLTDIPYILATLTAILEGCLVGVVFGAFVGSLKYKPEGSKEKKKKEKVKEETIETTEMFPNETVEGKTISTSIPNICNNCGAKLTEEDEFCTNCGAKR